MAGSLKGQQQLAMIRAPPTTKVRRVLKGHFGKITALHWAGDSQKLVSASQDGNLLLWNTVTANKLQSISLKSSYVMSVGMEQSKGNMVACGGLDNLCTVYQLDRPEIIAPMEMASHDGFLSCCRFVSEEHILTSSGDSTCLRWDIASGRVLDTFAEHDQDAMFLSLRPNDKNVFVSCSVDKTIKVWDIRSSQSSVQTFRGHSGDVNCVEFMPSDGNAFATCSEDGTARLWDMRAYQCVNKFGTEHTTNTTSPNTSTSPSSSSPPGTGNGNGSMTSLAFSGSGRLLFAGHSDSSVLAYDVLTADKTTTPSFQLHQAHDGHVSCIGVSPNGDALCTGSWDSNVKIWA